MLTLTLTTTTDLGPAVDAFAVRARAVAGEAPPSADELAEARRAAAKSLEATRADEATALEQRIARGLPSGIRLQRLEALVDGLALTSRTTLTLEDPALIPDIALAQRDDAPPLRPFAGFTVKKDQQGTVVSGRAPRLPDGAGSLALSMRASRPPVAHNATVGADGLLQWTGDGFDVRVVFAR